MEIDYNRRRYDSSTFKKDKPHLERDSEPLYSRYSFLFVFNVMRLRSVANINFEDLYQTPSRFMYKNIVKDFNTYWKKRTGDQKKKARFSTTLVLFVRKYKV